MKFDKILVPTDFSPPAVAALERAIELARATGSELLLLHTLEDSRMDAVDAQGHPVDDHHSRRAEALHALSVAVQRARARGVPAHAASDQGLAHEQIVAWTRREGADLIVMGSHTKSAVERLTEGSVAELVMCDAPVPVLIVHGEPAADSRARAALDAPAAGADERPAQSMQILLATDLEPTSRAAEQVAFSLAERLAGRVHLLHVLGCESDPDLDGSAESARRHALAELERRVASHRAISAIAECVLQDGAPAAMITRHAARIGADLIVLGTHGGRGLRRLVFGSVATQVVRHAQLPVLVVKAAPS